MFSNITMHGFLITAPCPPLWNLTLYSMYCSNVKLSCDQRVLIVQNCMNFYINPVPTFPNNNITCSQMTSMLKSCLMTSLCIKFHEVLTNVCLECPEKCIGFISNHSSLLKIYEEFADQEYLDDGVRGSGEDYNTYTEADQFSHFITDTPTSKPEHTLVKKSSSTVKCNTLCVCIIITVLCILAVGVAISITCVCRQERQGKKRNEMAFQRAMRHDSIVQLQRVRPFRPYRPYSYQDQLKPKVYYAINRSKSVDWNLEPMSRSHRNEISPAFQNRNSFKII